mgnify:CR=1 FL=1
MEEPSKELNRLTNQSNELFVALLKKLFIIVVVSSLNFLYLFTKSDIIFVIILVIPIGIVTWTIIKKYLQQLNKIKIEELIIKTKILKGKDYNCFIKEDNNPIAILTEADIFIERLDNDYLEYNTYLPITKFYVNTKNNIDSEYQKNIIVKFTKSDIFKISTDTVSFENYPEFFITHVYLPESVSYNICQKIE